MSLPYCEKHNVSWACGDGCPDCRYDTLQAENEKLKEALEKISNFFVTDDANRYGRFIDAGAIDIARKALADNGQPYDGVKIGGDSDTDSKGHLR